MRWGRGAHVCPRNCSSLCAERFHTGLEEGSQDGGGGGLISSNPVFQTSSDQQFKQSLWATRFSGNTWSGSKLLSLPMVGALGAEGSPCLTGSFAKFLPHILLTCVLTSASACALVVSNPPNCSTRTSWTKNVALTGGRRNQKLVTQLPKTVPLFCLLPIKPWGQDKIFPPYYSDAHLPLFPEVMVISNYVTCI